MKKVLFGTTALLAAGAFVSTAQASDPIKLSLGGYMEYYVVGGSQDGDYTASVNSFDVQGDGEVWFGGKTTLDNGMTIGVDVQLEAGTNSSSQTDTIDESYVYVEGKYGKMILGSENSVAYLMQVNTPYAGYMGGNFATGESDTKKYLPLGTGVEAIDPIATLTSDANKISYFTPKFYGVQAGVSFVPSNNNNGDDTTDTIVNANDFDQAWAFGLTYAGTVSGIGVKASGTFLTADMNSGAGASGDARELGAGLEVSYQGFSLGGAVKRQISAEETGLAQNDGFAWSAAGKYAEGPYAVSLGYAHSSVDGHDGASDDDTVGVWRLGSEYAMGPGVILFSEIAYSNSEDGTNAVNSGNDGAIGGAVGLRLSF